MCAYIDVDHSASPSASIICKYIKRLKSIKGDVFSAYFVHYCDLLYVASSPP